jgi:hypothetical protein
MAASTRTRMDREALQVSVTAGLAADSEGFEAVGTLDNARLMPWGGRGDVAERTDVVAPRIAKCCPVKFGDRREVTRAHPPCCCTDVPPCCCTDVPPLAWTTAITARQKTDVEKGQRVDCREANVSEYAGSLGEHRARSHRARRFGCLTRLGDPGPDVGAGRHHVVVEKYQVGDVGFVGPGVEAPAHRVSRRRRRHEANVTCPMPARLVLLDQQSE